MWKELKLENIDGIEKCAAEFSLWSNNSFLMEK